MDMRRLRANVRNTVRENACDIRKSSDPDDFLRGIADNAVPVYDADLAEVLASEPGIGFLDDWPFDRLPGNGIFGVIAWAICEELYHEALEELERVTRATA